VDLNAVFDLEKGKKAYSGFFSHLLLKKTRIAPETQK